MHRERLAPRIRQDSNPYWSRPARTRLQGRPLSICEAALRRACVCTVEMSDANNKIRTILLALPIIIATIVF